MRKSLHNIEIWGGRSISCGRMRLTILPQIFDFIQLTCKSTSWVLPDDIKKIVEKLPSLDAIFDLNFTEQTRLFDYLFIALWIDEEKENISQIISLDKELKTHPEDINNDKYFQLYRFNAAHSSHMETLILLFSLTDFTEITSSQIERLYNLEGRHLNMLFNNIEAHYIPGQTTTLSKANMLKAAITADDKDFQSIIDAIAQNQATKML